MQSLLKQIFTLIMLLSLGACSDSFLDRPPLDQVTSGNFYKTDEEVRAGTAPLYNIVWFDFNDKAFMAFGEARGGNLQSNDRTAYIRFSPSSTDQNTLLAGYKSFYKIIGQSNTTYNSIKNSTGNLSETVRNTGLAECRFMRAMAYYYLVCNWGAVPIIYDNTIQLKEPLQRNNIEDIWKFIIQDLQFAAKNLPNTPYQQGRITKFTAEGMLSRMYLMRSGYNQNGSRNQSDLDSAAYYANSVIKNSGLTLTPAFGDLFSSSKHNSSNNNPESLFSLQWMPSNTTWGVNNSFQAYVAYSPDVTTTGDGWGAAQGVSADVVRYFIANPADSLRRKATCMFNADFYPEIRQKDGGLKYEVTSISNIKKYVVGSPADNGGNGSFMAAYINTYMLRLAEVYLIFAEATLGNNASSTHPEALLYFNEVRKRAGMPTKTSLTLDDIFQEKRVEFIMEGHAWNEILRLYYFNPAKAIDYTANQDKGTYTIEYQQGTSSPRKYSVDFTPEYYAFSETSVYLPFPESEILNAPTLNDAPVSFDFSKLQD